MASRWLPARARIAAEGFSQPEAAGTLPEPCPAVRGGLRRQRGQFATRTGAGWPGGGCRLDPLGWNGSGDAAAGLGAWAAAEPNRGFCDDGRTGAARVSAGAGRAGGLACATGVVDTLGRGTDGSADLARRFRGRNSRTGMNWILEARRQQAECTSVWLKLEKTGMLPTNISHDATVRQRCLL